MHSTGYGRTSSSGVGFQGTGAAAKPEEYANHLLELAIDLDSHRIVGATAAKVGQFQQLRGL